MAATNAPQATTDLQADDRATPDDLVMLDEDESIRCENPEYSEDDDPYEWYYAYERDEVTLYHRENYFRPNAAITESQAGAVIQSVPQADLVDRDELVAAQRWVNIE